MTNTEKIFEGLERIASEYFDYWTEYKGKKTKVINLDAREAVKDLIHQTLAEERKRVVEEVEKIENDFYGSYGEFARQGFNRCRQKILLSLKKKIIN